jgi:putative spermidine/putrescine transport system permease protein
MACLLFAITAATMMFILAPLRVTVAISISDTSYVVFPPRGFTFGWYAKVLQDTDFHASLCFSCLLAVGATVGALLQLFAIIRSNSAPLNMLIAHVLVTTPYVVRTVDLVIENARWPVPPARRRVRRTSRNGCHVDRYGSSE